MGAKVRIPKNELTEFDLPRVCAITGETHNVEFFDVSFQFIPRSAALFYLFCGPIGYLVAMSFMRKTASGKLPFVEEAYRKWRQTAVILPILLVVGILVGVGGFVLAVQSMSPDMMPIAMLAFVVLLVGGIIGFAVALKKAGPACVEIDETHVTLDLPSAAAASAFEERLYAPKRAEERRAVSGTGRDALDDEIDAEALKA